jgi:hypothetical protein
MVSALSLWLPVVLSAVFVFIASSVIHMATPFHLNDWRALPKEDEVMEALRRFDIPPGDYGMPKPASMAGMRDPGFVAKMKAGPVAFMTVVPAGPPAVGGSLGLWFGYLLLVSAFAAYVCAHALPAGIGWRAPFRIAGCTAFAAYSLALIQHSIWYRRSWATTLRSMFDGLIYGLLTAATFGWLWPQ